MSEPCRSSLRKGSWSREEDNMLKQCVEKHGEGKWHLVPARAALNRCRKSCRLRWTNYLRPGIKRGDFEEDEIDLILRLHKLLGNRWSLIAGRIPGRTANDIKNYWNTNMRKKIASPTIKTHIKIPISSQSNMVIKPHPEKLCKKSNNYDVLMMPSKAHVITNVSLSNVDVVPLQNINTTQLNEIEVVSNWKDIFWDDFDVRNFLVEDEVAEEEEDEENIISCKDKAFSPTYLAADVDLWDISF